MLHDDFWVIGFTKLYRTVSIYIYIYIRSSGPYPYILDSSKSCCEPIYYNIDPEHRPSRNRDECFFFFFFLHLFIRPVILAIILLVQSFLASFPQNRPFTFATLRFFTMVRIEEVIENGAGNTAINSRLESSSKNCFETATSHLLDLALEIIYHVIEFLPRADITNFSRTSKACNEIVLSCSSLHFNHTRENVALLQAKPSLGAHIR